MPLPLGAVLSQFCPIYHTNTIVFSIYLHAVVGLASCFVLEYFVTKMFTLWVAFVIGLQTILNSWISLPKKFEVTCINHKVRRSSNTSNTLNILLRSRFFPRHFFLKHDTYFFFLRNECHISQLCITALVKLGHAMALSVDHQPVTAEVQVHTAQ
jgi:hypothetical protein